MPTRANPTVRRPRSLGRFFADVALTGHAVVAAAWLWLMPGGFAVDQSRFWINAVLPWVVIASVIAARSVQRMYGPVLAALAMLWLSAAVAARIAFPDSFRVLWPFPAGIAAVLGVLAAADGRSLRPTPLVFALFLGLSVGAAVPFAERAAPPATRPTGGSVPLKSIEDGSSANQVFRLSNQLRVADDGNVRLQAGLRTLTVLPLLTFDSRSPDGCWILFADGKQRRGPARQLDAARQTEATAQLAYRDDARSTLTVESIAPGNRTRIEAISHLPHTIWSHLNTFTELQISARGALSVSFSPCPTQRIEIQAMEYPFGKPARFAFLDAAGVFHVVEARNAEKGPFRTLASGPLADATLTLTFFEAATPIFRVTLEDWAAQASRQTSPTAGWGVPENAIEFSLEDEGRAQVFITLASTSVGRGYDTVGHTPGVYRNRLTVEALAE